MEQNGRPRASEPVPLHLNPQRSRSDQVGTGDTPVDLDKAVPISWKFEDQLKAMSRQPEPRVLFQSREDAFYSAAERVVENSKQEKASAAQWKALLTPGKTPGIKSEEIEWTGIHEWLDMQKGPIEKGALLSVLQDRGIKVEEVVLGRPDEEKLAEYGYTLDDLRAGDELRPDDVDLIVAEGETQFATWSSDPSNPTYRELLITLPLGQGSNPERAPSTHWDTEAVVAHVRFMEKTDAEGKKVMFIEEVQSDWHQKGRDQGYQGDVSPEEKHARQARLTSARERLDRAEVGVIEAAPKVLEEWRKVVTGLPSGFDPEKMSDLGRSRKSVFENLMERIKAFQDTGGEDADAVGGFGDLAYSITRFVTNIAFEPLMREQIEEYRAANLNFTEAQAAQDRSGIPDAPFKSSWPALVMKRAIRWAVDAGADKIAWTTGEEQANRYNLSAATGPITISKDTKAEGAAYYVKMDERAMVQLVNNNLASRQARVVSPNTAILMTEAQLKEAFGGDVASRLVEGVEAAKASEYGYRNFTLKGDDLRVGGEGMKAFYDRNLVNITNDIIK
jgi:hypothetical protein